MRILNIVGARPNLVKIAPLLHAMKRHPELEPVLLHTGQHYDAELSEVFFRQMGIPEPEANLHVGSGSQGSQTAEILARVEEYFIKRKPDLVLVVGDVNSTMAATLAAVKLGIPVAHVESGLRSFDRTMPEEINRIVTDALADYLFVTEPAGVENLLREGRPRERIHLVGNVMIDALHRFLPIAQSSGIVDELGLADGDRVTPFALLTLHRPANVDSPEMLKRLLGAIEAAAAAMPVIFPVHPRTRKRIEDSQMAIHAGIRMVRPLGYLEFICLMSKARLVLTDSGGIQEETTALGVSCLTLRDNTERPATVTDGTNRLVGRDPAAIVDGIHAALANHRAARRTPALWDGRAAERIVDILIRERANIQRRQA